MHHPYTDPDPSVQPLLDESGPPDMELISSSYRFAIAERCFRCNETGHEGGKCPNATTKLPVGHCNCCGEKGHGILFCPRMVCKRCKQSGHVPRNCPARDATTAFLSYNAVFLKNLPAEFEDNVRLAQVCASFGTVLDCECRRNDALGEWPIYAVVLFLEWRAAVDCVKALHGHSTRTGGDAVSENAPRIYATVGELGPPKSEQLIPRLSASHRALHGAIIGLKPPPEPRARPEDLPPQFPQDAIAEMLLDALAAMARAPAGGHIGTNPAPFGQPKTAAR